MTERPDWDSYFLDICRAVAARADCTRRRVGAVIVDRSHRILSCGYNGAPSGEPGCLSDGACPRGRHYLLGRELRLDASTGSQCACGNRWPCPNAVSPSSSYDSGPGTCPGIHAEMNAIMFSSWEPRQGGVIYVTCVPCPGCRRMIRGSGIKRIVWPEGTEIL